MQDIDKLTDEALIELKKQVEEEQYRRAKAKAVPLAKKWQELTGLDYIYVDCIGKCLDAPYDLWHGDDDDFIGALIDAGYEITSDALTVMSKYIDAVPECDTMQDDDYNDIYPGEDIICLYDIKNDKYIDVTLDEDDKNYILNIIKKQDETNEKV